MGKPMDPPSPTPPPGQPDPRPKTPESDFDSQGTIKDGWLSSQSEEDTLPFFQNSQPSEPSEGSQQGSGQPAFVRRNALGPLPNS